MQLFVRTLRDGTVPVVVDSVTPLTTLQSSIQGVSGVPIAFQRLRYGQRDLRDDTDVAALPSGATVCVLLRLVGGKGGFGSLLRVQGRDTKATTNFEACRDLSGRRLRHVNAVKKMEEWKKTAQERQLADVAQKHLVELARQQKREKRKAVDPETVSKLHRSTVNSVKNAVESALKSKPEPTQHVAKKPRFLQDAESESDDEGPSESGAEDSEQVK